MARVEFVRYDDDTMGAEENDNIHELDPPEDSAEVPFRPYWHGVEPEDGYARYLILWDALHARFGGTSYWKPAWKRLSLEGFQAAVLRYESLDSVSMLRLDKEDTVFLQNVGESLLVLHEEAACGPEGGEALFLAA